MTSTEIRNKFIAFFKNREHTVLASAPLVPENDPTVLFNTAGMQPLVPYLMGREHPSGSRRLVDIQKCVRTGDIDDIGDNTHATFFEMMGNWSLGDYFKFEAINWSYEFLTSKEEGLGLDPQRLYITVFEGDENAPKDEETGSIWREIFEKNKVTGERIYFLGKDANWWPAVKKDTDAWSGPTGPCTEMFYDLTGELNSGMTKEEYLKADEQQKVVEIWNNVFMEYVKENGKIISKLEKKNVDTGSGFERMVAVVQGKESIFDTDVFAGLMQEIANRYGFTNEKTKRIVADHVRTATFMIADGVLPSNTDRGYILRRLLRRAIFQSWKFAKGAYNIFPLISVVVETYKNTYPEISNKQKYIESIFEEEENKFLKTIKQGEKEFNKITNAGDNVSGKHAFILFSSYGFPYELTKELAAAKGLKVDEEEYKKEFEAHQALSRMGAGEKFKGGLADTSDVSVRYHTATHLLHQALFEVLGERVEQKGSNINTERMRFDFAHSAKMTAEEIQKVEDIVNSKINLAIPVQHVSLPKEEALKIHGVRHLFLDNYGDNVTVYYVGDNLENAYSKEFCGGPHVTNTKEIGKFKIIKEEAVSTGIRRIKAVIN